MAVHLLTGDDEVLLRTAVAGLVTELVGDGDRAMMVDEFDGEDYEIREVVDAAQTPPFLTDKRVIVARGVGRFTADDLGGLLSYLDDPLDSTDLVLAGGGGRMSTKLTNAVKKSGTVTATAVGSRAGDRRDLVAERARAVGLTLQGDASDLVSDWLGESPGKLDGLLAALESAHGPGARLSAADVIPFLGEAGGLPPWDLTDAIDAGNTARALDVLRRMIRGGERHPLMLMSSLHRHYAAIARLDGADARTEQQAAQATGLKGYPAKKALNNYRRLGGESTKRAIELLAAADLDLRGESDLDDEIVMEVLVARLSRLGR